MHKNSSISNLFQKIRKKFVLVIHTILLNGCLKILFIECFFKISLIISEKPGFRINFEMIFENNNGQT